MNLYKNILLFEPDASGHHSGYLYHLIINYLQKDYPFNLVVLVSPDFFEKHPEILQKTLSPKVEWIKFSDSEYAEWLKPKGVFKRAIFEWQLFCQYALDYRAALGFFMYIDYLQLAILTQSAPPCTISGILFRPTLVNYPANSWKEKLNYWRKSLTLKYLLKNKSIKKLFNLDPFATEFIKKNWSTDKVKFLPDPVQVYPNTKSVIEIKKALGIEENRKVFLIFGFLDSRKGIADVMQAIGEIDREKSKKGCLLIVGPWEENERKLFEISLSNTEQNTDFQIVIQDNFIQDEDIQQYFEVADYALALYQKHIGMSAIMVRAAAAQKPLITYNFGLMGKIVAENQLGLIINDNLKPTIEMLLSTEKEVGNKKEMKAFAELNQAKNYADVILSEFKRNTTGS
ncbi:MAG: glycosyltransferase [Bacteroidota bacterium]|jgi:glycosyltransferase involved in cell wall biosynthesis